MQQENRVRFPQCYRIRVVLAENKGILKSSFETR